MSHPTDEWLEAVAHQPWACEYVEGPSPVNVRAHRDCRCCVLAIGASVVNGWARYCRNPVTRQLVEPSDYYEQSRHLHDLPPLPERRDRG